MFDLSPPQYTKLLLLVVVLILVLYNIIIGLYYGPQATISAVVSELASEYPMIPFVLGVLLGHFFWPIR